MNLYQYTTHVQSLAVEFMQNEYHKLLEKTGTAVSHELSEAEWNKQFIQYLEKRDAENTGTASS